MTYVSERRKMNDFDRAGKSCPEDCRSNRRLTDMYGSEAFLHSTPLTFTIHVAPPKRREKERDIRAPGPTGTGLWVSYTGEVDFLLKSCIALITTGRSVICPQILLIPHIETTGSHLPDHSTTTNTLVPAISVKIAERVDHFFVPGICLVMNLAVQDYKIKNLPSD
ncbi:hypothetical protein Bbelb_447300 [Branchiostoma belcheri]|nr:hypothetical protein Bbelb_447300 [Branchiostoma belcheri]